MSTPTSFLKRNNTLILGACVGLFYVVLLLMVSGTLIQNDATWFMVWQQQVRQWGMAATYVHADLVATYPRLHPLNYPPLYLYVLEYVPLPAALTGFLLSLTFIYLVFRKTSPFQIVVLLAMPVTLLNVLIAGQIDYFVVFLVIVSILLFEKGSPWLAGIMAGLSLGLKEEAVIFVPVFVALALRNRKYLYSLLLAFGAVFLPLAGHLPLALKVSYLNNVGLYKYMTMNGPNIWSLFINNLKQGDTVYWRYLSYLLSLLWAGYMFWRHKDSGDWLAFCYCMTVGFLFWPTQSQIRYEAYPFAFAYYLWKVQGRQEFSFPAYFFGISGGIILVMAGFSNIMLPELIFVKACAVVTGWFVWDIVRKKTVTRREKGVESNDNSLEAARLAFRTSDGSLQNAGGL